MLVDQLDKYKDHRGVLTPVYLEKCPFIPVRLFCVTEVPKFCYRGGHAHRTNKQYLICLQGNISVTVISDFDNSKTVHISAGEAVFIDKMKWDTQRFNTGNDVLLVLCSEQYNEQDYIRNILSFYNEILLSR
jgi:dTDP-4-dehydrorhamnose 3,5-epimerase-like enzyme